MRNKIRARPRIIVLSFVIVTLIGFTLVEATARLAFTYRHQIAPNIDPTGLSLLEMVDPSDSRNWKLRPQITLTLKQLLEAKRRNGAMLAVQELESQAKKYNINDDSVVYHANSHGYKGPELRSAPEIRVLTLGDSCTFGSQVDRFSYARVVESSLQAKGFDAEVVNAGINGYTPWNVLLRIDEFKKLKPDVVTIYIGWNALFERDAIRGERWLQSPLLFQAAWTRVYTEAVGRQNAAFAAYKKIKHADMNSAEVKTLSRYEPPFLEEVEKIINAMQQVGARVVAVTIPGLFVTTEYPSEHALTIGHLPDYTDNPFVLATMAERYNQTLRNLAHTLNVSVIDLEQWSTKTLRPRDAFFNDSVHLTDEGQEMIGTYMAQELMQLYPDIFRKRGKEGARKMSSRMRQSASEICESPS